MLKVISPAWSRQKEEAAGNEEYFKTQAVIARTYMYRYLDKHMSDRYNVCDNTHCQAFNGTCSDTIIHTGQLWKQKDL